MDSANFEGEVRPMEFDTALPVEHNVSIHGECGQGGMVAVGCICIIVNTLLHI